jgi:hypothetical protein
VRHSVEDRLTELNPDYKLYGVAEQGADLRTIFHPCPYAASGCGKLISAEKCEELMK